MKGFLGRRAPYVLFLFLSCLLGCATVYNPATGRNEFIIISTDQEVAMGKNIHQEIGKEFGLLNDAAKLFRLRRIGQKLASSSDRQDYAYNFYLVSKDDLNAFTTPGGNVYFYDGLYQKMKSDDEIAAVLAHEIGHCAARHTVKKYQAAEGYHLIGSLLLSQIDERSRAIVSLASNTAVQLAMTAYGRQDEYEADRLGVKYMYLAGYRLNGMIETLTILKKESQDKNAIPLILRTHPYLDDRIKAVTAEIEEAPLKYKR